MIYFFSFLTFNSALTAAVAILTAYLASLMAIFFKALTALNFFI